MWMGLQHVGHEAPSAACLAIVYSYTTKVFLGGAVKSTAVVVAGL